MSAATDNLRGNQRQLDMDGCEVGVSRQAVEETLAEAEQLERALRAMLTTFGRPHRHEWLNQAAYEEALRVYETARALVPEL